ncbi:hypothetical protein DL96DRAFT_1606023 [Flagelloscypha sp. PMI_526]|nr:hypothetical protein DL96DRAFT_1606023 [Flagelloscypha sp. PMI_526]
MSTVTFLDSLPPEIIHAIISLIPRHPITDLRNYALSCRAFRVPAQVALFSEVTLARESNPQALLDILTTSPHIGGYITQLCICSGSVCGPTVGIYPRLLALMPSVWKLEIRDCYWTEPLEELKPALVDTQFLSQILSLDLTYMRHMPIWFVKNCMQLRELSIYDGHFVKPDELAPSALLPLRHLGLSTAMDESSDWEEVSPIFRFLVQSVKNLVSLEMQTNDGPYGGMSDRRDFPLARAAELLAPTRNTLLCLDLDSWPDLGIQEYPIESHPFSLHLYPKLLFLSLRFEVDLEEFTEATVPHFTAQITWLAKTFETIPSPHPFRCLCIDLDNIKIANVENVLTLHAWLRLDQALNRKGVFPRLEVVAIRIPRTVQSDLERLLPVCHENGLLITENYASNVKRRKFYRNCG